MKKGRIIDYLTVRIMNDKGFMGHHHDRARAAWLMAKKEYEALSEKERQDIIEEIKKNKV